MNLRTTIAMLCCAWAGVMSVCAQQDLQSSTYAFSPLAFNPAYAGSRGTLNVHAVNRAQWLGFEGAPRTQILSVNAPVLRRNLGVGLSMASDRSGARSQSTGLLHVAYHLPLNETLRLSMGLAGGTVSNGYDFSDLRAEDPGDAVYADQYRDRALNFGAGAYVWSEAWYVGLSMPHLVRQPLAFEDPTSPVLQRHLYLSGGYAVEKGPVLSYRFTGLFKMTSNAPATMDWTATAWAFDLVGVGAMYRMNESIGFHAAYQLAPEVQVIYAVDLPFNRMRTGTFGSHEVALLFDLSKRRLAFESPRYF